MGGEIFFIVACSFLHYIIVFCFCSKLYSLLHGSSACVRVCAPGWWCRLTHYTVLYEALAKGGRMQDICLTYPGHDSSVEAGQLGIIVRYLLFDHPVEDTHMRAHTHTNTHSHGAVRNSLRTLSSCSHLFAKAEAYWKHVTLKQWNFPFSASLLASHHGNAGRPCWPSHWNLLHLAVRLQYYFKKNSSCRWPHVLYNNNNKKGNDYARQNMCVWVCSKGVRAWDGLLIGWSSMLAWVLSVFLPGCKFPTEIPSS